MRIEFTDGWYEFYCFIYPVDQGEQWITVRVKSGRDPWDRITEIFEGDDYKKLNLYPTPEQIMQAKLLSLNELIAHANEKKSKRLRKHLIKLLNQWMKNHDLTFVKDGFPVQKYWWPEGCW